MKIVAQTRCAEAGGGIENGDREMAEQNESQERSRWLDALDDYVLHHYTDIYEGWYEQEGQGGDIDLYRHL